MNKNWQERGEYIYQCVNGFEEDRMIRNETVCGGILEEAISRAYNARNRLCARYGIDSARDRDLDELMSAYEELSHQNGLLMYGYGRDDKMR